MKQLLEVLTKPHDRLFFDEDTGDHKRMTEQPLLEQLREAVFGGMETGGGSSGFTARMPISSGALDLYTQIEEEITDVWVHAFPQKIPGAEKPETMLIQAVAYLKADSIVEVRTKTQRIDNRDTHEEHWYVETGSVPQKIWLAARLRRACTLQSTRVCKKRQGRNHTCAMRGLWQPMVENRVRVPAP